MFNRKGKKRKAINLLKSVADNIRYYRMKRKLSQEQLEEETRLPVSRYESGRNDMTLTSIFILSKELGVEPYKLLMK